MSIQTLCRYSAALLWQELPHTVAAAYSQRYFKLVVATGVPCKLFSKQAASGYVHIIGTEIADKKSNNNNFKFQIRSVTPQLQYSPFDVKLKRGGRGLWFGNLVCGSRNSLKKLCAQASNGDILAEGVYSKSLLQSVMASGGVFGRNTCRHGRENGHELG